MSNISIIANTSFIVDNENNSSCEPVEIPPDEEALTLTFGRKNNLLQKLHDCRDNKVQVDRLVLDQVLGKLEGFPGVKVFSTYCPWDKRDLPFYERYVAAEQLKAAFVRYSSLSSY